MTTFEASRRSPLPHAEILGPADPTETALVTLFLRRRSPLPQAGSVVLTREELRERHGADPADVAAVRTEVERLGLDVVFADAGSRRVQVRGTVGQLSDAFGVSLHRARHEAGSVHADAGEFRYRTGEISLPDSLRDVTVAVLGLDTRPQATAHFRRHKKQSASGTFTPLQVGAAYQFPAAYDGTGQGIALIELGGGYDAANLTQYFQSIGVTPPQVTAVPVDGGSNAPTGSADGPDGEVQLDIEVAGALAPGSPITVYFSPNTDQGFADAVTDAAHATPTPTAISISWGGPENSWSAQSLQALDAACADAVALGITVLAAAGDNGSTDGGTDGKQHCDFPASSPHVLACGGTTLALDGKGAIASETVWNDQNGAATGGGVSAVYPVPSWQSGAGVPNNVDTGAAGRGVPDVAGNADPASGYQVLIDGTSTVIGGTSAVAPLWAALVARLAQQSGKKLGLLQTVLYAGVKPGVAQPGFQDVTSGSNGAYSAGAGWDACTGLGTPDGATLPALFGSAGAGTAGTTASAEGVGSGAGN
ncbi:S8/S53 family peptidase [Actinospica sp. MGRD01-02]|uniref:S8/S53 family peptidase n=1 Tax=Actinospica acidithermotolerans TaxID=2828514 RepID=A0A941EAV1_9ACTN|nr:S53 family peptidase [Actinospica acidithermotolerans]MBR7827088.1 S8/S53 family peptidase [Actinospica acidithermotolerans]